jgi:hypothetical protein
MKIRIVFIKFVLLALLMSFTTACGEEDDPLPNPPSADITGQVKLYDEGTNPVSASGMTVSAEGLRIEALTDGEGRFQLEDVLLGPVVIVYEKSGYGTFKNFVEDFSEDLNLTEVPSLGKISQTDVITNSVSTEGMEVRISSVTTGTNTPVRYLRYFFSARSDVSSVSYDAYLERPVESDPDLNPVVFVISAQELNDLGFPSGRTVYVRVYGDSFYSNDYEDPNEGRRIFPNLFEDTAQSVQFEVP